MASISKETHVSECDLCGTRVETEDGQYPKTWTTMLSNSVWKNIPITACDGEHCQTALSRLSKLLKLRDPRSV